MIKLIISLALSLLVINAWSVEDARAADRLALQEVMKGVSKAFNERNVADLVSFFGAEFQMILADQSVYEDKAGLDSMVQQWFTAPDAPLTDLQFKPAADKESVFYNDNLVLSLGSSEDTYILKNGESVVMNSRWSATLIKKEGKWKIINLHTGINVTDNAMLSAVTDKMMNMIYILTVVALIIGAIVGFVVGKRRK
ncbi:MAG: hypothetical protein HRU15_01315 [Planctomycetes bacterium]|nr:hypothetical protein [Planctomycetota bacterium]